jgi:hypothetical protein
MGRQRGLLHGGNQAVCCGHAAGRRVRGGGARSHHAGSSLHSSRRYGWPYLQQRTRSCAPQASSILSSRFASIYLGGEVLFKLLGAGIKQLGSSEGSGGTGTMLMYATFR